MTRNTEPHQKWLSNTPPTTGPVAAATPATAVQMAMARPRSRSLKMLPRIDKVAGMVAAPPRPITPRATASCSGLVVNAATAEAVPNTLSPTSSRVRRP